MFFVELGALTIVVSGAQGALATAPYTSLGVQYGGMRKLLRGLATFVFFVAGFSVFLELGRRYRWIEAACIGLIVGFLLVGSLVKLWRAARYSDFSLVSGTFWLPLRWRAWLQGQSPGDKRPRS